MGHVAADCQGTAKRKNGEFDEKGQDAAFAKKPYQFLNIWTLREYLEYEFRIPNPPFEVDFERIVDDFIFMCFFVGNDFLPHMPTLEIREGAINLLMAVYKNEFRKMGGYLTNSSKPNLRRVEHFIQAIGAFEDKIFHKRARLHQRQSERIKREKEQAKRGDDVDPQVRPENIVPVARYHGSRLASGALPSPYQQIGSSHTSKRKLSTKKDSVENGHQAKKVARLSSEGATIGAAIVEAEKNFDMEMRENKEELKTKLKEKLKEKSDLFNSENPDEDKVKLGEPGWKERYYQEKFSAKTPEEMEEIQKDVVLRYTEGLCWVMEYYYEGVCSWQWFYPYHYAPFASDMKELGKLKISFTLGSPFKPFDQLMGVFPAASAHALPECYRRLMTDPNSPILDFYPTDFEVDMNGKRFAWQGIAKLPFIDEARLLAEIKKVEHTLTEDEQRRNSMMSDLLFINGSHPLSPYIFSLNSNFGDLTYKDLSQVKEKLDSAASGGMNGYLCLCNGDPCPPVFKSPVKGMEDIMDNQVICSIYKLPDPHNHIARPLPGVVFPKKIVTASDIKPPPVLWHEESGRRPPQNLRQNPPGTISGRQLGEAARRLVINSLSVKREHNAEERHLPPYNAGPNSVRWPNDQQHILDQTAVGNVNDYGHRYPSGNFHRQLDGSSASVQHQYARPLQPPQYERDEYNRHNHPKHGSGHPDARVRFPEQSYPQNGGYQYTYSSRPVTQSPVPLPNGLPRSGHNSSYSSYQLQGAQQWEHGTVRGSIPNHTPNRGPYAPDQQRQQFDNRYSTLNRGSNRRPPPPPGFGR